LFHSKQTKQRIFDVAIIFTTSVTFYWPAISKWKGEIATIGNPDPVNYALVNRHVMSFGFNDTPHLVNRDLGSWAKWDWTGVHGFFGFFNSSLHQYSGSTTLLFVLTIVVITQLEVVGLIRTLLPIRLTWLNYLVPLLVVWGFSSQLYWYSVGSGFIAQLLFMALTPLLIVVGYQIIVPEASKSKSQNSRYGTFIAPLVVGVSLTVYFPYASMVLALTLLLLFFAAAHQVTRYGFRKFYLTSLSKKHEYLVGFLVFAVAVWPVIGYIKTGLIVLTTSRAAGWALPDFSINQVLPTAQLCLPGSDLLACKSTPSSLILASFIFVISISILGILTPGNRESREVKFYLLSWIFFFVGIAIIIVSKYGIAEYRSWKFLTFIQLLIFSIFIPLLCAIGVSSFKSRHLQKSSTQKLALVLSTLAILLVPQQRLNLWSYSVYTFGVEQATADLINDQRVQKGTGLDIEIDGVHAMLVALYIPNQPIAFVRDAAYYPPVESSFSNSITLSSELDAESTIESKLLNSKYVIVVSKK
jgi:hypothetical protein